MSFKYHKISEKEKKEIQQHAQSILGEFASKLEKIKPKSHSVGFQSEVSEQGLRDEQDGWDTDKDFLSIMMSNAPFADTQDNTIIAEKGGWNK